MAKEIVKSSVSAGGEKLKEQVKETTGRADSPENYAGEKTEQSAEYLAHKAKDAVGDAGSRVRQKIVGNIRDGFEKKEHSNEREHSPRQAEQKPAIQKDERIRTKDSNEYLRQERPRDRTIRERPQPENKHIKTKEEYIHSQGKEYEKPKEINNTSPHIKKLAKEQVQSAQTKQSIKNNTRLYTGKASRPASDGAKQTAKDSIKTVKKGTVKTVQAAGKGTVKTTKVGVKTAERTAKTSVKAAKTTAKAAQKAAQAAAKAAKAAAQAAVRAAKVAAKAVSSAVKATIAAIKGLIAAIAAGGWIAVVVILAIAVVALILCACFGVFASNETADGSKPMTEAIQSIDVEFRTGIDNKVAELSSGEYDEVIIEYVGDMDGDSDYIINWNDVIAVYSVRVTMDDTAPTDVVEVTPEKIAVLKETFYDMNSVSYDTKVSETEETFTNEDGEEETVTKEILTVFVDVKSMEYTSAADLYQFDDYKRQALEAMMEPQMILMYAELIGVDIYDGADLTKIISGLPAGTMGSDVLNVALTKVGAPYVLGAKGPKRFDCSGLVYWSINEIDPKLGRNLYTSAGYQYKYCKDNGYLVGESEARPGDIIFWQKPNCHCSGKYNEIHHTGFYLGDGMILDASSSNGRVIIRKLFSGSSYKVYAYARPYSY